MALPLRQEVNMTTFERWRAPSNGCAMAWSDRKPMKKYDIRLVDQFYLYCQALARTARHRDDAYNRSLVKARRQLWSALIGAALLFYYLVERVAQAMLF
jgi:hypothetical protein